MDGIERDFAGRGLGYIGITARDTPSAANVLAYARIVRDRARRRELIQLGTDLQQWAMRDDAETALAKLKSATESIADGAGNRIWISAAQDFASGCRE